MISAKYKMYKKLYETRKKYCAWVWGRASDEQRPVVCVALHDLVESTALAYFSKRNHKNWSQINVKKTMLIQKTSETEL